MGEQIENNDGVLLLGNGRMLAGIALCLVNAGHGVSVCVSQSKDFLSLYNKHRQSYQHTVAGPSSSGSITVSTTLPASTAFKLVIIATGEDREEKERVLKAIEPCLNQQALICINTESYSLESLQAVLKHPQRLLGLNWTEPAHTTLFLEIINTPDTAPATAELLRAARHWRKDFYIVRSMGIRSRLISALAREAFYLVDNGYASVDDIDRACRNDAGYYLPFSGNCRYMDLMGTYAYGMVMKDLNPDLSKSTRLPAFFEKLIANGAQGMENRQGFYSYAEDEVTEWRSKMDKFSYEIKSIIEKYPFNYTKDTITK